MATITGPNGTAGNLAPTGSTGNNTHTAVNITPEIDAITIQFVVEAVGGSPTVTWKCQGTVDGTNWYDLPYITDASSTVSQATRTATAVGAQVAFLDQPTVREFTKIRLVTTSNTNVTYRGEIYLSNLFN